jgi:menaquinone-dependent protoporphyrinogen oxidase
LIDIGDIRGLTYYNLPPYVKPNNIVGGIKIMAKRILVAYDTVHGSTGEIAEFVGKELRKEGNTVDVRLASDVTDIDGYEAVVAGSPVIRETWNEAALDFIKQYKLALNQLPMAMFFTCLALLGRTIHDGLAGVMTNYVSPLLVEFPDLKPVSIGLFVGVLDYSNYTPEGAEGIRRFMRERGCPLEGRNDYRDWQAIGTWAREVSHKLETNTGEYVIVATGQPLK